jgi:hypothetical protein
MMIRQLKKIKAKKTKLKKIIHFTLSDLLLVLEQFEEPTALIERIV